MPAHLSLQFEYGSTGTAEVVEPGQLYSVPFAYRLGASSEAQAVLPRLLIVACMEEEQSEILDCPRPFSVETSGEEVSDYYVKLRDNNHPKRLISGAEIYFTTLVHELAGPMHLLVKHLANGSNEP